VGSSHRSKRARVLALATTAAAACAKDVQVTSRTVTMHVPQACAVAPAPLDGSAYALFYALGDFEPQAPSKGHLLGSAGEQLPEINAQARVLAVDATEGDREWLGAGSIPAQGAVDVLLLPSLRSCPFSGPVGSRTGSMLGAIGGQRVLVVGGSDANLTPSATYVARLDTGEVDVVGDQHDLGTPRTKASVTAFGGGGLVAGGFDTSGIPRDTAEVYMPELGAFDQQHRIVLSGARADHGAVVLVTGETLLVGGVGADGKTALDSMEIVDPTTRTVRAQGVARLSVARHAPTVLRLASGEVLVAGGLDSLDRAIATIEWIAPDASHPTRRPADLVAGSTARAYAALQGGGALAVVAPPPSAAPGFQNVWVIDADGVFAPATPIAGSLTQPVLFGGAGGAPALWTGAGGRWLRWQPWSGAFGALDVLDETRANVTPADVAVPTESPAQGLALWLDPGNRANQAVTALRFDLRGEYSTLRGPLLVADTSDMAPDRLVEPGVVSFDPSVGLELAPGASAFVTDRTYADVSIDVDAPTGEPSLVVLRDELGNELEVGGAGCPAAVAKRASASSLHVERTAARVTWAAAPGAPSPCATGVRPDARLTIGVRGSSGTTRGVVRNLRVSRLGQR
jgi:hypothetical protein